MPPPAPRLRQGGRLPALRKLAGMTTAELNLQLRKFGLEEDRGVLMREAVERNFAQLTRAQMAEQAVVDKAVTAAESTVRRRLMAAAKEAIRAHEQRMLGEGDLEWQAVGDDRTCVSCDARDGQVRPAEEWDVRGRPGSDNLVCGGNCRCLLVEPTDQEAAGEEALPVPEAEPEAA